jgi:hypothetical protein
MAGGQRQQAGSKCHANSARQAASQLASPQLTACCACCMPPASAGSLRKALQRKAFRPSAKWPFQTTYVRARLPPCLPVCGGKSCIRPSHSLQLPFPFRPFLANRPLCNAPVCGFPSPCPPCSAPCCAPPRRWPRAWDTSTSSTSVGGEGWGGWSGRHRRGADMAESHECRRSCSRADALLDDPAPLPPACSARRPEAGQRAAEDA